MGNTSGNNTMVLHGIKIIFADDSINAQICGVSGDRFVENLQTGLLYGGLLSINAGNTATLILRCWNNCST
jgi:hypothetical protein